MTKEFKIDGMKCDGCVKSVTNKFEAIPGVERALVDLDNQQAVVETNQELSDSVFKEALSDTPYSISE